jgi:2-polyprenyl-6-methoxyphenol hydroxylase-like FAD-dependent oxidoreductase
VLTRVFPSTILSTDTRMQDADAGSITLADGLTLTADVIVAADGIRSNARPFVIGMDARAAPTGESAYQWLVPIADLQAMNSSLLQDGSLPPRAHVIRTPMRKIVANPIRGGTVLNFLAYVRAYAVYQHSGQMLKNVQLTRSCTRKCPKSGLAKVVSLQWSSHTQTLPRCGRTILREHTFSPNEPLASDGSAERARTSVSGNCVMRTRSRPG